MTRPNEPSAYRPVPGPPVNPTREEPAMTTTLHTDGHSVKREDGSTFCVADTPEIADQIVVCCNGYDEIANAEALLAKAQ